MDLRFCVALTFVMRAFRTFSRLEKQKADRRYRCLYRCSGNCCYRILSKRQDSGSAKADVIFLGSCEHTGSMAWIKLRKRQYFEYAPANFLDPELYEGTFEKKGDSVVLKFDDAEPKAKAKLVFREKGKLIFLCELDSVGKIPHDFHLDSGTVE